MSVKFVSSRVACTVHAQCLTSVQSILTDDSYKNKTLNTQNKKDSGAGVPIHKSGAASADCCIQRIA